MANDSQRQQIYPCGWERSTSPLLTFPYLSLTYLTSLYLTSYYPLPHPTLPYLTLPQLTSPCRSLSLSHLTSSHLIVPCITSYDLTPTGLTLPHLSLLYRLSLSSPHLSTISSPPESVSKECSVKYI